MNAEQFRKAMHEITEFIIDYKENMGKDIRVLPAVEPGYLPPLLPSDAPRTGESWTNIMDDFNDLIMPGITHWQHPQFHAYFPSGNSYPSILGDLLSSGLGIIGFSWLSSPACTELETIIMNWLGKMVGLEESLLPFKIKNNQSVDPPHTGGGVILGSASECTLVSMLAARCKAIGKYKKIHGNVDDGVVLSKLVAYTSKLAHSCVEKNANIALVKIRLLEPDKDSYSLRGSTLEDEINNDISQGLIPFFVCGTFGTTGCCSFDNVAEIGLICQKHDVYLHIDAAYAGNALICEELRYLMPGISLADSFSFNPNKWMLTNFDCSCLWVKNRYTLKKCLSIHPSYLQYSQMNETIDYKDWGIALSRRFKSLKLWFTIRSYGIKGLQEYIRNHVRLAANFESLVLSDNRFEIFGKVTLGLVCFRLKGSNTLNKNLVDNLNANGNIHLTPAIINDKQVIRFCVTSERSSMDDIKFAWELIKETANLVKEIEKLKQKKRKILFKVPFVVSRFKFQSNLLNQNVIVYEVNAI